MRPTPRTDDARKRAIADKAGTGGVSIMTHVCRNLERELAEAQERNASLNTALALGYVELTETEADQAIESMIQLYRRRA